ncbi:portal protein [Dysgonomonas termitidis]|uniref:Phage portal protein n=1 Tax=Dysgonomonas termitidis TaxID=1516126 RepID=A0ABV9L1H9_9BACT
MNHKIFNKKKLGIKADKASEVLNSVHYADNKDILQECAAYWYDLRELRHKRKRCGRYVYGKQWEDLIPNPDRPGGFITERQAIMMQGKTPLQNNMIRRFLNSIVGQFRTNQTEPVCTVRDSDEVKIGEMMTIALQANEQLNKTSELDAINLFEYAISACAFYKIKYDIVPSNGMLDGIVLINNPARMFWNADMEDPRGWDLRHIGEIHDLRIADVLRAFAKNKQDADYIRGLYHGINTRISSSYGNMTTKRIDNLDFYIPQDDYTCRVIESWRFESKQRLRCIDEAEGSLYWVDINKESGIKAENERRINEATAQGVDIDDVLLIKYEWAIHQYWYYRFLTPYGNVLSEGESPYWHKGHPYTFNFYSSFDGEPHSFVEDLIDPQRMLNRMYILQDFIISSGAKNTLIIDADALNGQSPESIAESYVKVGSVIVMKPKTGIKISESIHQIKADNNNVGTYEMINLMMSFMNDISGVHGAARGEEPKAGTAASLYAQEAQNAATNVVHLINSFNSLRTDRDIKLMKVLQQYYDSRKFINTAGVYYSKESKYYNPETVQNSEMDISLAQSTSTAAYRSVMDTFLLDMFKGGAITLKMLLENSTLPFKDRLLQSVESAEQSAENGQMQGFSPEMMQEIQGQVNPEAMNMLSGNFMPQG